MARNKKTRLAVARLVLLSSNTLEDQRPAGANPSPAAIVDGEQLLLAFSILDPLFSQKNNHVMLARLAKTLDIS